MARLPSWWTATLLLAAACGSEPSLKPSLDRTWLGVESNPPGTADVVVGGAGATAAAERVRVFADPELRQELGSVPVAIDGSFRAIDIGDNRHGSIWLVAEGKEGRTRAVKLDNDVAGPVLSITQVDAGERKIVLSFSSNESCITTCSLDGEEPRPCGSPATFDALTSAEHRVVVTGVDDAGNMGTIEHTWSAGGVARVSFKQVPDDLTNSQIADFAFSCGRDVCEFSCSLDGAPAQACTSPAQINPVAEGAHRFTVRGLDPSGAPAEPASHEWTVDLTPPVIEIETGPPALTNRSDPPFVFSCNETGCTYACSYDGGEWQPCRMGDLGLPDGGHQLDARAIDRAGNAGDPSTWSWTLDRRPPVATIDSGPAGSELRPEFTFSCDEPPCTFVCSLDDGDYVPCNTPFRTEPLLADGHQLRLIAVDAAGNQGPLANESWLLELPAWTSAALGLGHGCGLDEAGGLWCWGANRNGELGDGTTTARPLPVQVGAEVWSEVAAGEGHTCAIRDGGTLWCWGRNDRGQLGTGDTEPRLSPEQIGTASDWVSIAARSTYTCGIRTNHILSCWGGNARGQLGDGTAEDRLLPTQISNGFTSVAPSFDHTCAIKTDGTLWCWGSNADSALGTGQPGTKLPARVGTESDWATVVTGEGHSCGLRLDGTLWCWGRNQEGQGRTESQTWQPRPAKVDDQRWLSVSGGEVHTCAVRDDFTLWCWGTNDAGQLGMVASELSREPVAAPGPGWRDVITAPRTTCGLRLDDTLICWGGNDGGLLARGSVAEKLVPAALPLTGVASISTLWDHACALDDAGAGSCWGDNRRVKLGSEIIYTSPTALDGSWRELEAGDAHSCGIKMDGTLWCWGANDYGQLGVGDRNAREGLQQIGSETDWSDLSVGAFHSCARRSDGVWCWGWNSLGQVGAKISASSPVRFVEGESWAQVDPGTYLTLAIRDDGTLWSTELCSFTSCLVEQEGTEAGWTSISAGDRHSCGIRAGELWCWGDATEGRLGSTTSPDGVHFRVGAGSDWLQVSAGIARTCGIRAGGTLWCWGDGDGGGIGDGSLLDRTTPVQIDGTWEGVSVGRAHTCAVATDHTAWCWGWNDLGQLGDGAGPSPEIGLVRR